MRRRSQFIVFALASLLGVTACTGAPEPDAPDPPEPIVTADVEVDPPGDQAETDAPADDVPSPEPLPLPEYPADLTAEDTAENAVRAAEYFLHLINHMQSTGDTSEFAQMAVDTCATCERMVHVQEERKERNGYLVGNFLWFENPRAEKTDDGLAWVVNADVTAEDGVEVVAAQVERRISGRTEKNFRIGVQLVDETWRILEFARGKES